MRASTLLLCAALLGLAASQGFNNFRGFRGFRPQRNQFRGRPQNFRQSQNFRQNQNFQQNQPQPQQNSRPQPQQSGGLYYSWRDQAVGRHAKFTWGQANDGCRKRGQRLVSLDSAGKNQQVVNEIDRDNVAYIWTGGRRSGRDSFVWANGQQVQPTNWGQTGGSGAPQPDNRVGNEDCLAILNKFYDGDGITWHDVACHHKKPYVCE